MRLLQTMYRCVKMHYNICDDYYDHCRIRILGDNTGRNMNEIEYWESFLNNFFPYPRLLSVPRMYKKKKQIQRICLLNIGIAEKVKKKSQYHSCQHPPFLYRNTQLKSENLFI